jgi:hypothetical protein
MSRYLLIASREPFTCGTTNDFYALATDLKQQGHDVTLLLVENGVMVARAGVDCPALELAAANGVKVLAERFALRERAIPADALVAGVAPAELDYVIDCMVERVKTIWH